MVGGLEHGAGISQLPLLEEAGFVATALDLTGSGIDHTQTNNISTCEASS